MSTQIKPPLKELRAEVQRLGITFESVGCSVEELIRQARNQEDPMGWLAIHAPPAESKPDGDQGEIVPWTEAEPDDEQNPPVPPAEAACELAVDAENEPIKEGSVPLPTVKIVVPQADTDLTDCYISCHVDVRMTRRQGVALRRLCLALDAQNVCLANGRRAVTAADAVRWLLEEASRCSEQPKL